VIAIEARRLRAAARAARRSREIPQLRRRLGGEVRRSEDEAIAVALVEVMPAQEVFAPLTTFNPTFELEYFRFGLTAAT
jgi:hypothetical protein